jgi:hypothetical protein
MTRPAIAATAIILFLVVGIATLINLPVALTVMTRFLP